MFVTFRTHAHLFLPERIRDAVLNHCLHDHLTKIRVHAAVVMPDHIHHLFTPLRDDLGIAYSLLEVLQALKGASAHTINKLLARAGPGMGGRIV